MAGKYTRRERREDFAPGRPFGLAHAMLRAEANSLRAQAWRTLGGYVNSKVRKSASGNPYGHSIARAAEAFYASFHGVLDPRLGPELGRDIVSTCEEIGRQADIAAAPVPPRATVATPMKGGSGPAVLVLGATGFIGREVVRQLSAKGQAARISKAKQMLGWRPAADRAELIEQGIAVPVREWLA